MKKNILCIIALFLSAAVNAEDTAMSESQTDTTSAKVAETQQDSTVFTPLEVNYDSLKAFAEDENRYQAALKKFNDCDTTITIEDSRNLYYGFTYRTDYSTSADRCHEAEDMKKKGKMKKALKLTQNALKKSPVCMSLIEDCFYLQMAVDSTKKEELDKLKYQYNLLMVTVLQTGTGKDADNGIKLNWVGDEYAVLRFIRVNGLKKQSLVYGERTICDKMDVVIDGKDLSIYFDITRYFEEMNKLFSDLK